MFPVKVVLNGIHPLHHIPEIQVVELISFHEKVIMKKIGIAQRIGKEKRVKISAEYGCFANVKMAVKTSHEAVHFKGVTLHI